MCVTFNTYLAVAQCDPVNFYTNVLDLDFDQINGQFHVSGFDFCMYSQAQQESMECHNICTNHKENCIEDCLNNLSGGLAVLGNCVENCNNTYHECSSSCGEFPTVPEKSIVGYESRIFLWFDYSATSPGNSGEPNEISTEILTDIHLDSLSMISHQLNSEMPGHLFGYCYWVNTTIMYDDGSCCKFTDNGCVDLA